MFSSWHFLCRSLNLNRNIIATFLFLLKNTDLALCLSLCRVIGKYFYRSGGGLAEVKDFSTFDDFFFLFVNDTSKSSLFSK